MPSQLSESKPRPLSAPDRDARASFLSGRIATSSRALVRLSGSALKIRNRALQAIREGKEHEGNQLMALFSRVQQRQALILQRMELLKSSIQQIRPRSPMLALGEIAIWLRAR